MPTFVNGHRLYIHNIIAYVVVHNNEKTSTVFAKVINLKPLVVKDLLCLGNKVNLSSEYMMPNSNETIIDVSTQQYTDIPMELSFEKMFPHLYI